MYCGDKVRGDEVCGEGGDEIGSRGVRVLEPTRRQPRNAQPTFAKATVGKASN